MISLDHTVDGRNLAPPGMYLANSGINYQPQLVIAGFLNHEHYGKKTLGCVASASPSRLACLAVAIFRAETFIFHIFLGSKGTDVLQIFVGGCIPNKKQTLGPSTVARRSQLASHNKGTHIWIFFFSDLHCTKNNWVVCAWRRAN